MENFEYYAGKDLIFPQLLGKPILPRNASATEAKLWAEQMDTWETNNRVIVDQRNKVHSERESRDQQFRADLFKEFGVSDNPKKDKCYALASQRGHSGGYSEIYNEFIDLVELIID